MKSKTLIAIAILAVLATAHAAVDGNSSALQAAIDSAAPGSNLTITPGTYNWSSGVTIKKFIKLVGTGVTINSQTGGSMFTITPQSSGSVELAGFTFNGASGLAAYITCKNAAGKPPLVHDCTFNTTAWGQGSVLWEYNGGVIYNCTFASVNKADSSAIQFKEDHSDSAWHEPDFLGMADSVGDKNTYVEDCTFKYHYLQAMDFDGNSRTVVRHCVFDNSAVTSHGQDTGPIGGRQVELYSNKFLFTPGTSNNPPAGTFPLPMDYTIYVRQGGPMIIWDNEIPDMNTSAWGNKAEIKIALFNIRRPAQIPCQKTYPASRQIGWGIINGQFALDPIYIWGNTGGGNYDNPGFADWEPDQCGNNLHTADFVKKNREFYCGTAKPGYQPYTYPHPLRGGGPGPTPTPSATANPTPTAVPTPTSTPNPSPTATATPSPSVSYSGWYDELANWIKAHPPVPNK
jgi:hypothetical protein